MLHSEIWKAVQLELQSQTMQRVGNNNVQAGVVGGDLQHINICNVTVVIQNQASPVQEAPTEAAQPNSLATPPGTSAPRPQATQPQPAHRQSTLLGWPFTPAPRAKLPPEEYEQLKLAVNEIFDRREARRSRSTSKTAAPADSPAAKRLRLLHLMAQSTANRVNAERFMQKHFHSTYVKGLSSSAVRRTLRHIEECSLNIANKEAVEKLPPGTRL